MWASAPTKSPAAYASYARAGRAVRPYTRLPHPHFVLTCHSEPSPQTGRGNPYPPSLPPSAREAARSAGGRDMPRQRRGTRGDVGIAPYVPSIEHPRCSCVVIPRARSARGNPSPFHVNSGQRPPPTFAAARQRRDLIIAQTPGGCFQRGRAAAPPSLVVSRGKDF